MQYNFDVFRTVHRDGQYSLVTDYVSGVPLVEYIRQHPNLSKEQLFLWFRQIIKEADDLIRMGQKELVISPFYFILISDQTVAFLDCKAHVNQRYLKHLTEEPLTKRFSSDPFKAIGQTMQFLLAKTTILPKLTVREECKLKKIISRCLTTHSKKRIQAFSEILEAIPNQISKENSKVTSKKKKVFVAAVASSVVLFAPIFVQAPTSEQIFTYFVDDRSVDSAIEEIRKICENRTLSKTEKERALMRFVNEHPGLKEKERFLMLQVEYGFCVKEGKVCFER